MSSRNQQIKWKKESKVVLSIDYNDDKLLRRIGIWIGKMV